MSDYTPTTERVRHCATTGTAWLIDQPESFDRWLAAHDAEIRDAALGLAGAKEFKARNRVHFDLTEWSYETFVDAANDIGNFLYPEEWEVVSRHVGPWRESGTK